jgi:hypothetical protein
MPYITTISSRDFVNGGWENKPANDFLTLAKKFKHHLHKNDHNEPHRFVNNCAVCEAIQVILDGQTEFEMMTGGIDILEQLKEGKIPF